MIVCGELSGVLQEWEESKIGLTPEQEEKLQPLFLKLVDWISKLEEQIKHKIEKNQELKRKLVSRETQLDCLEKDRAKHAKEMEKINEKIGELQQRSAQNMGQILSIRGMVSNSDQKEQTELEVRRLEDKMKELFVRLGGNSNDC